MTARSFFGLGMAHPEALQEIIEDVQAVEFELRRLVMDEVRVVQQVGAHTLQAGGKRLRPAFLMLTARAIGNEFIHRRAVRLGACLEMIHMATLIHDDVIDRADTRRGRETAAAIYGNTASILAGDVLLAKAMRVLADDGDLEVIRTVSAAVVEMAAGEAREVEVRGDFDLSAQDHFEVLRLKTAAFVECCCRVGAIVAEAPRPVVESLAAYGHHIGMAFQIVDDLLDFRGEQSETGKPLATDFREGVATLPLIYLRDELSPEESEFARRKFGNGVTDDELRMIGGWMEARGAFSRAEEEARRHVESADRALEVLPASAHRELLQSATRFVLDRRS